MAIADGQGGRSGGAPAARIACQACLDAACGLPPDELTVSDTWVDLAARADAAVAADREAGYTTLVAFCVRGDRLAGASVGDSAAVLLTEVWSGVRLTDRQQKNPPIGSGEAFAMPFGVRLPTPWAVLAITDGVWKYGAWEHILPLKPNVPGQEMVEALLKRVRLPGSGELQDDFTAVALRCV